MANKPAGATSRNESGIPGNPGRIKQIFMVVGIIRKSDPWAMPITIGSGVGLIVVFVVAGLLLNLVWALAPLGVLTGVTLSMFLFGRYAQTAQYKAIEDQPGAAAAILERMRGGWTVTPAVSANRTMDVVHRAVGKPGVVLVGEGSPTRLPGLLAAEKKRISRVAYDVPIFDFQVGKGEGQIPLRQLERKITRLPRTLKGPGVADLNYRLKALPSSLQAPKGPLPRGAKMPRAPRPRMR